MRPLFSLPFLAFLASAAYGVAPNQGYYMQPAIHGDEIVFVSQGDLWRVGIGGGLAHSLTSHGTSASHPAISPDGRRVAFTGAYEGPAEAYVMSLDGGLPERLTYDGGMNVAGWTPDGKVLAATSLRATLPSQQLVAIDPQTRRKSFEPLSQASEGSFDPSGRTLYFTRFAFQGSYTKRYQGGTAQNLWKYTEGAPEAIPLTKSYAGTSKNPMWWNHRVYFLSDRDGWMNLWSMDENGGDLRQLTHNTGWDIQSASLDKGRIVYQLGADLHVYDVATKTDKALDIDMESDFDQTREEWITNPGSYVTAVSLSSDGSKIALTARGQVFVAPVEGGRFVQVTHKPSIRYREATFTPDGKSVLALSDETGETEWWKLPANGVGATEEITRNTHVLGTGGAVSPDGKLLAYGDKNQDLWLYDFAAQKTVKITGGPDGLPGDLAWSPDSQWLAYSMPTPTFNRIMLYSVKTGQSVPVTTDRSDASNPAWSPDGKWLYFLSDRTFNTAVGGPWGRRQPEPYFDKETKIYQIGLTKGLRSPFQAPDELTPQAKPSLPSGPVKVDIDLNGIEDRLWEVPIPAGNYGNLNTNGERLFVTSYTAGQGVDLAVVDVKNRDASIQTLAPRISGYGLSHDGKKLLVQRNGQFFVFGATPGAPAALDRPVDLSGWSLSIQPQEEWKQMFTEAWRLERDYFYDRNMHGVNWTAVLQKYEPLVDRVRDRSELSNLLSQMVGELSTLHTFVYGGDARRRPDVSVQIASLGGVLTRDESLGGYRVERIYSGDPDYPTTVAPLARPDVDVAVGDTILAVNGIDTLSVPDVNALLRNQAGKQVLLHVKSGATGAARDVIAVPISPAQLSDLKYTDWELSRRRTVESESKGTIGYVHLRAMGGGDIDTWAREFYPVFNRSGLIIDVRHNNGGNIDSWILEKLLRKAWFYWQPRVGNPTWNMQYAFRGHVVVLCDESTASDGEAFTEGIKRLGIGKVIGTRTWGGEVWLSSDNVLEDNGIATAAETGVYGPEGRWLIEGHGVDPDITVDNLPHATFLGKDAQLQAAIDYLSDEIKKNPVPIPPAPKYPDTSYHPKK